MRLLLARVFSAALLRRATFREVGEDPMAILHALGTVILVGMATGLGLMGVVLGEAIESPTWADLLDRLFGLWAAILVAMVGWILWSVLVYATGTVFLRGEAGFRSILRALGVAYAPGVLMVLRPVPSAGVVVVSVVSLWVLVVAVVAVREVEGQDWFGAILSTFLGWFMCFVFLSQILLAAAMSEA